MKLNWLYRLSDWNPQVFRELKGRLKRRNVLLTVLGSLSSQLLVLLYFWSALPTPRPEYPPQFNRYCTVSSATSSLNECVYDTLNNPLINWQRWWLDMFQVISWALPFVLLIAGVYLLIGDLGKEERRGTLNFIRLSPQTSQNILLGKLLGVPAVPYLAVLLALPLHGLAAIAGGVSIASILSVYLLTAAACAFFYSAALLYALMGGFQGWVGAVFIWISYTFLFQLWQTWTSSTSSRWLLWFHFPIGGNNILALTFALLTLGISTYWLWQAVNRRFRNPDVTLLSKRQSYGMTLCFEVWMIGFVFENLSKYDRPFDNLIALGFCNLLWFMVLIAALTPQRQMLLDWARYRRERVASAKQFWSRSIVKDLLWGEKSPALVAIALNLLIGALVVTPWILSWRDSSPLRGLATISLGMTFVLICAAIAQLMMFMKSSKRVIWAVSTVAAVLTLPPIVFGILRLSPNNAPLAWLFSIGAFAVFQSGVSMTTLCTAFLGHLGILSLLSLRLTRQLQQAGESETKALLAVSRS